MTTKKLHYISGLTLSVFIGLHLYNHLYSIFGADKHIQLMNMLRHFYRNVFVETVLLVAVVTQVVSGMWLFRTRWKFAASRFDKLHIWSGLYLAIFLVVHLAAVFSGRLYLHVDTNFYFGVAGLNTFPFYLFFVPYYGIAIISFFGHIASVHNIRMKKALLGLSPNVQAKAILLFGICLTVAIFYGLTGHFKGVIIPKEFSLVLKYTTSPDFLSLNTGPVLGLVWL